MQKNAILRNPSTNLMSKLYVFGIGGTGSRVLRALTMLLAAGVKCQADTIMPIIIDPDEAAADLTRTVELMKKYGAIHSKLNFDIQRSNRFFKTEIKQTLTNFRLPLRNTADVSFKDFMDVNDMTQANQALVNMLFSQDNLRSNMQVGFKGNPNVGSVVLNQFDNSPEFKDFANEFTAQDKIFIVSSIFGGTGASGFPLLLKTLRTIQDVANKNYMNNAHIGAITILPYFAVQQDDTSHIDSATFVSKAKSALAYYERNISRNNAIDSLYYIADNTRTCYENCEGGQKQQNNAHFIELASALAVIDFAKSEKQDNAVHKEYGIETDATEIIFNNLGKDTKDVIQKALTQFVLFSKYLKENKTDDYLTKPWAKDRELDQTFFEGNFIKNISTLQTDFLQWLKEMATQQRKFTPFELHFDPKRVFDLVKGIPPKKVATLDANYDLFNNRLNKQTTKGEKEQQLMELFYKATEQLAKEKFNIA